MITRLQTFFLKHNKWLFGGLLVVIIVTFVLTIGPQSFFGSGGPAERKSLRYYGYDLASESDQRAMAYTAEISSILHPELQVRRDQLMDYAYLRVAALGIADRLGIGEPSREDLARYVESLPIFSDPQSGGFSAQTYQGLVDALQANGRYTRESIATVLQEDFRIREVRQALSGPDYSLPFELKNEYLDQQTTYDMVLARLDYESFAPVIEATEEELTQFYRENPSRYEIPETLSVTALLFKGETYLEEVAEPEAAELEAYFTTNKARYQTPPSPDSEEENAPEEVKLEDIREVVAMDWKREQARRIAAKKGEQFSLRLWQESVALDSPAFEALLEEFSVQTQDIPPYSRNQAPRIPDAPVQLLNSMWIYANNPNRYFSDIAQISEGAVVLITRDLTEARLPAFDEVRERVLVHYQVAEKRRLFAEKGTALHQEISSRLGEEPFATIAASLDLETTDLESFTGENIPAELQRSNLWEQSRHLEQGAISEMLIQASEGLFVYVQEKNVPELEADSEDFQAYVTQRTSMLAEVMGWARLQEITDQSLTALLGSRDDL